jgi:DNA-binding MarR family transcriptional regulator
LFFKTFGFKRLHGRIWGLLVLAGQPLASRDISEALSISQGSTSTSLTELAEWGMITSSFDSDRRCHVHDAVGNTLSIVATIMRRREQVAMTRFRQAAAKTLIYVRDRYGERDPRVLTLRSILSSCEIAEAVMQLVLNSVESALGDSQSLLSRALQTALKVGLSGAGLVTGKRSAKQLGGTTGQITELLESATQDDAQAARQLLPRDENEDSRHD